MTDKAPLIVVAHDFSPASKAALERAKELAVRFHARLVLVHVVDESAYNVVPINMPPAPPAYLRKLEEHLRERLERDGGLVREGGLDCETILQRGPVAPQILACLEERKPLFAVMGTHGLTGWRHALLGSVAERVVQRARCPVLVVPDPERPLKCRAGRAAWAKRDGGSLPAGEGSWHFDLQEPLELPLT